MDNGQQVEAKKARVRRTSKNDETPRPYVCGCGRGYYSYPALYTHLKIKHDGNPPQGTHLPSDRHYGSRGRPREKTIDAEEVQVFIDEELEEEQKQIVIKKAK